MDGQGGLIIAPVGFISALLGMAATAQHPGNVPAEALPKAVLVTTAYTLIVLTTLFAPSLCRRSSATWTLVTTLLALAAWLLGPAGWRIFPHPIYFTWLVSLATFFLVTVADGRRLAS